MFKEKKKYLLKIKRKAEMAYNQAYGTNRTRRWKLQIKEGNKLAFWENEYENILRYVTCFG